MSGSVRLLGLILAGGQSSRMGTDKALVDFDGKPMAAHVAETMYQLGAVEVMLGGAAPRVGQQLGLPIAPEPKAGFGPLSGLAAGLTAASTATPRFDVVVVCPCDVPLVAVHDLQVLLCCLAEPEIDVACFRTAQGLEPLVSAWRPDTCTGPIADALDTGQRAVRDVIGQLRHVVCSANDESRLVNINTGRDLTAALTAIRGGSKGTLARPTVEEPR